MQQGPGNTPQPTAQATAPIAPAQQTPIPPTYMTFQAPAVVAPQNTNNAVVDTAQQFSQPVTTAPSIDEAALLQKIHKQQGESMQQYGHLKTIQPLSEQSAVAPPQQMTPPVPITIPALPVAPPVQVTAPVDTAIINLANNDDLNIATLARQANKVQEHLDDGEVVISLH